MTSAIIVAAGKGIAYEPLADKLFLPVMGRPLIAHTWHRFEAAADIDTSVLVVRPGMQASFAELAAECKFKKPFELVAGGPDCQDSVWNGLEALPARCSIVVIQDGARPCTSPALIAETIKAAQEIGAAVAAQRVADTIKESDGGTLIARTIDRARLWAVQTPRPSGWKSSAALWPRCGKADWW